MTHTIFVNHPSLLRLTYMIYQFHWWNTYNHAHNCDRKTKKVGIFAEEVMTHWLLDKWFTSCRIGIKISIQQRHHTFLVKNTCMHIKHEKKNNYKASPSLPLTVTRYLWATKSITWPYRGPGPCPCTTTLNQITHKIRKMYLFIFYFHN